MDTGRAFCIIRQRQEVRQHSQQRRRWSIERECDCDGEGGERRRGKEAEVRGRNQDGEEKKTPCNNIACTTFNYCMA